MIPLSGNSRFALNGIDLQNYLLDSNIIIYHLNGEKIATDFINKNYGHSAISRISYIEVMSFDLSPEEEIDISEFLNSLEIYDTSSEIATQAIINRRRKSIKVPDNIIASTAQVHNLILVTRNSADFSHLDLEILDIFEGTV